MEAINNHQGLKENAPSRSPDTTTVQKQNKVESKEDKHSEAKPDLQIQQTPSADEVKKASVFVETQARSKGSDLEISVSNESNQTVVKVKSKKDGQIIAQFPPEELLRIAENIDDAEGLFLNNKV